MADAQPPPSACIREVVDRAHSIDLVVRFVAAAWIMISAMASLIIRTYGQLSFGSTVIVAILLTLAGTQLPNIIAWTRDRFSSGNLLSARPWALSIIAGLLIIFVYFAEFVPRFLPSSIQEHEPDRANQNVAALQSQILDLRAKLDVVQQTISTLESSNTNPSYIQKIGPINLLNAFSETEEIMKDMAANNTSILITGTGDNEEFKTDLTNIFDAGIYRWMFAHRGEQLSKHLVLLPPNPDADVDVPKLPRSNYSGIVVHGEGTIEEHIRLFLGRCFIVRKTRNIPAELAIYYKRNVIWIEIGGPPVWRESTGGEHSACGE
jgi:hypothetical protein